ncbi:MAG: amidohydrolase family protein [Alistipes communis]
MTSFVDMYYFENRCVEVAERLGIRALLAAIISIRTSTGAAAGWRRPCGLAAAGSGRVRIAVAPHSPYTVSPENLVRGKELADKHGLHLMTHISETQASAASCARNTDGPPWNTSTGWGCWARRRSAPTAST